MIGSLGAVLDPSWRWLVTPVVLLGAAPGIGARLISLMYAPGDPRRQELIAEVYVVPYHSRPIWLGQQLEVAVCEGLPDRWRDALASRAACRWSLEDGEDLNRQHPDTFWLPPERARRDLNPGDFAKVIFRAKDGWGERMWVEVANRDSRRHYTGKLVNRPVGIGRLLPGDKVKFRPEHVIDIDPRLDVTTETAMEVRRVLLAHGHYHCPPDGPPVVRESMLDCDDCWAELGLQDCPVGSDESELLSALALLDDWATEDGSAE
jgi:hypothetical protein